MAAPSRFARAFLASAFFSLWHLGPVLCDERVPFADPRSFGLSIPVGPVVAGDARSMTVLDDRHQPLVARLHARVGRHCIVLLPDGQLVARRAEDVTPTDRRFVPASCDEVAERLKIEFPGFRIKKTRHYVFVYDSGEEFALVTSRILESMIPGMLAHAKGQQIAVDPPQVPLVAVMFRSRQRFQQYRQMPEGVVAYYHTLTNRIVMCEQSPLVAPRMALQQTISTIAHEGAHQILHNIGVQQRLSVWPLWLSEGLAEYYAPTTFGKRMRWKGAGKVNDLRMFELDVHLRARERSHAGQLVEETVRAGRLTSTGYAAAWSLTHWLASTRRSQFNEYVKKISQLGPLESLGQFDEAGAVAANLADFAEHFGDELGEMEHRLLQHLHKLPYHDPSKQWPHFVATVVLAGGGRNGRDANFFHSRDLAKQWIDARLTTMGSLRRDVKSNIRSFPNRMTAETFAREWMVGR